MGGKKSLFWVHVTFTELYWHVWFISPFHILSSMSLQTRMQTSWWIRKNMSRFPSRLLSEAWQQSCSICYHENMLFVLLFVNYSWPVSLFPEETPVSLVSSCRWQMRKGGGFEEHGERAMLCTVTAGFSWSLFCCFLEFKSRHFFPFSYWIWV